jgi:beta-lactamase regulating signal transducer with metallopeptidase domain
MKKIFGKALAAVLIFNMYCCTNQTENEIEAELQAHFNNFAAEASAHGMNISFDDIDINGYIQNIEERGTLGQCKSYSNGSKAIVIDQLYWNRVNDREREYLVFHELGHCVLGREHKDTRDENGICTSIMQSGDGGCEGLYNSENRDKLLEELFEI